MTNRRAVLAPIMAGQVMANGGLGIPSIAPLIREDLGLPAPRPSPAVGGWRAVSR